MVTCTVLDAVGAVEFISLKVIAFSSHTARTCSEIISDFNNSYIELIEISSLRSI